MGATLATAVRTRWLFTRARYLRGRLDRHRHLAAVYELRWARAARDLRDAWDDQRAADRAA